MMDGIVRSCHPAGPGYWRTLTGALTMVFALLGVSLTVVPPASADVTVIVEAGDSLSELAAEHGTSVSALMAANGITDPDRLYMGQELVVPGDGVTMTLPPLVVVVQSGDSLSGIATYHGVTVDALVSANGITDPDSVYVGQELLVPGASGAARAKGPTVVVVRSGDSLSEIAAAYGVTVSALMRENSITDPDRLQVGQRLTISGRGAPT
ncbi:MAG: LysM peptidoglycan-binding domain-containing protein, partial [Acidimicrobiales bacterium]|nr:LysM peptidoglycan-binding domain-containing protein [Acidimicrobiales bacterium]